MDSAKAIALDFIDYAKTYLVEEEDLMEEDYLESMGDWACKYSEDQDEVNAVLDYIEDLWFTEFSKTL